MVVVEEAGSLLAPDGDDGAVVVVGSTPALLEVVGGALMLPDVLLDVADSSVVELERLELASDEDAAEVEGDSVVEEGRAEVVEMDF